MKGALLRNAIFTETQIVCFYPVLFFTVPEESVLKLEIEHHINFANAYGPLPYTNYVEGFNGCLDYIFYDQTNLEVIQVCEIFYL